MIRLITGLPGHGKSLYAVSLIIDLAAKGETVYTNITGLSVPDVLALPDDFDWRDTPDGSYIFYDEAQYLDVFKSNGRENVSTKPICRDLSTHRKTGQEIYFITQDANYLHKHILGLVNEHINIMRPMGSKFPTAFFWSVYQQRPNTTAAQKKCDFKKSFAIKKNVHQYYVSASQHNIRFDWLGLLKKSWLLIAAVVFISYTFFYSDNSFLSKKAIDTAASATGGSHESTTPIIGTTSDQSAPVLFTPDPPVAHELQRVAYVVEFGSECYAKNSYGEVLDIPADKCRFYSDHPSMLSGSRVDRREYTQTQQPQGFASSPATISPIFAESTKNDLNQVKL